MPVKTVLTYRAAVMALGLTTATAAGEYKLLFAPGLLLVGLLVLQFVELTSCYARQDKATRSTYHWERAIAWKVGTWGLWVISLIFDMMMHIAPVFFHDAHLPLSLLQQPAFLPFSVTFTVMASLSEGTRAALNIKVLQGNDSDADMVVAVLRLITFINRQRWNASGRSGVLPERWTDSLTKEQIEQAHAYIHGKAPIPAWLSQISPEIPLKADVEATPTGLAAATAKGASK
jgi:hypothetical protein